jgi:hypothetical protein
MGRAMEPDRSRMTPGWPGMAWACPVEIHAVLAPHGDSNGLWHRVAGVRTGGVHVRGGRTMGERQMPTDLAEGAVLWNMRSGEKPHE